MLMPDYLKDEVEKYCFANNISITRGKVPANHINEVQIFIHNKLKRDRVKTRRIEEKDSIKIENILGGLMGSVSPCESPIEEFMYQAIKNAGLEDSCKPQFEIGTKRVDFAFPASMLIVECDGKEYHFTDEGQIEKDQARDKYLARKGWRVIHFEGLAIRRKIELCIEKIKCNIKQTTPTT